MNDFYVIHEAECKKETMDVVVKSSPVTIASPPHCVKDHVAELEKENEALRQSLTHAQEAFDIVSTVERMREINEIIRRALKVRDLCPRLVESERNAMHIKIEDLERQLVRERSGRLASEKKLSQYLRDRRKCKDSCTPKVPNQ